MPAKGQNRPSSLSFPTSKKGRPLYFQNSLLQQSVTGPCRLSRGRHAFHARVHHAEVGHQNEPFAHRPGNHSHAVYHVIVVTGGHGQFRLDRDPVDVSRKTLVTSGPGEAHCFERIKGESTSYAEVTFDFVDVRGNILDVPFREMLALWSGRKSNCRRSQVISEPATVALEQAVSRLVRAGLSPTPETLFFRLSMALGQVLEQCLLATLEPPAAAAPWEKAHRILLEDYTLPLVVGDLAARIGVHPDYLTRRFRKAYGTGPLAFQNSLRIEAAKTWLISTDYTLKEIAARIGYDDPGYFARIFRQTVKMSPGQFRKEKRLK